MANSAPDTNPTLTLPELIASFEAWTLDTDLWDHHAHIKAAAWYIHHYGREAALCYLRANIINYNRMAGGINDHNNGYHETLTLFWHWVVAELIVELPEDLSLEEKIEALLKGPAGKSELAYTFWSRNYLFGVAARARWMEPDLQPLEVATLKAVG